MADTPENKQRKDKKAKRKKKKKRKSRKPKQPGYMKPKGLRRKRSAAEYAHMEASQPVQRTVPPRQEYASIYERKDVVQFLERSRGSLVKKPLKPHESRRPPAERYSSPGPGAYDQEAHQKLKFKSASGVSLRTGSVRMASDGPNYNVVPGPGRYHAEASLGPGANKTSQHKSAGRAAFPQSKRFSDVQFIPGVKTGGSRGQTPGPGSYDTARGSAMDATRDRTPQFSFGGAGIERTLVKKSLDESPGPGQYHKQRPQSAAAGGRVRGATAAAAGSGGKFGTANRFARIRQPGMPESHNNREGEEGPGFKYAGGGGSAALEVESGRLRAPGYSFGTKDRGEVVKTKDGLLIHRPSSAAASRPPPPQPGPAAASGQQAKTVERSVSASSLRRNIPRFSFGKGSRFDSPVYAKRGRGQGAGKDSPGPGLYVPKGAGLKPAHGGYSFAPPTPTPAEQRGAGAGQRQQQQRPKTAGARRRRPSHVARVDAAKEELKRSKESPGPGAYLPLNGALSRTGIRPVSGSGRFGKASRSNQALYEGFGEGNGDCNRDARGKGVPGPGAYAVAGKSDSRSGNTPSCSFGGNGVDRSMKLHGGTGPEVGPGQYDSRLSPRARNTATGSPLASNGTSASFGVASRETRSLVCAPGVTLLPGTGILSRQTPGPGTYDVRGTTQVRTRGGDGEEGEGVISRPVQSTVQSSPGHSFGQSTRGDIHGQKHMASAAAAPRHPHNRPATAKARPGSARARNRGNRAGGGGPRSLAAVLQQRRQRQQEEQRRLRGSSTPHSDRPGPGSYAAPSSLGRQQLSGRENRSGHSFGTSSRPPLLTNVG